MVFQLEIIKTKCAQIVNKQIANREINNSIVIHVHFVNRE